MLCKERFDIASKCTTPPWTVEDFKHFLKQVKSGKSRDPYNFTNEQFKPYVAWDNLILALTKLMNRINSELIFPRKINF